mmetsp:Transcript_734/g.783  ORF Transcript_734/g.783 Transcript_734/m.783 type:complete len:94 (+) Transcript_734:484-765(+)
MGEGDKPLISLGKIMPQSVNQRSAILNKKYQKKNVQMSKGMSSRVQEANQSHTSIYEGIHGNYYSTHASGSYMSHSMSRKEETLMKKGRREYS